MSKGPWCGAPITEHTQRWSQYDTCRRHVAVAGTRCYQHRKPTDSEPADRHE